MTPPDDPAPPSPFPADFREAVAAQLTAVGFTVLDWAHRTGLLDDALAKMFGAGEWGNRRLGKRRVGPASEASAGPPWN